MKKKKLRKHIRKRMHNVLFMARQGMKDFEIAAEIDLLEDEFINTLEKMPEQHRLYTIAKSQGYSRDMELLKEMMNNKDVNSTLAKVYFAQRHGITDRVDPDSEEETTKTPVLNVILQK